MPREIPRLLTCKILFPRVIIELSTWNTAWHHAWKNEVIIEWYCTLKSLFNSIRSKPWQLHIFFNLALLVLGHFYTKIVWLRMHFFLLIGKCSQLISRILIVGHSYMVLNGIFCVRCHYYTWLYLHYSIFVIHKRVILCS